MVCICATWSVPIVGGVALLGSGRVLEERRGPIDRAEHTGLHVDAPGHRVVRVLEGHAERALARAVMGRHRWRHVSIAATVAVVAKVVVHGGRGAQDLVPAVLTQLRAQQLVVGERGALHAGRVELPERGRARDIGEHDRHIACGRGH
jgi:hypothetical protein